MDEANKQSVDFDAFFQTLLNHSTHLDFAISKAIYTPENTSYTQVLKANIHNPRFATPTTPKPFLIIAALHGSHVQAAVNASRTHGLQMKIRSGGHDYEGSSYVCTTPFFILDMSNLRDINVDLENESAWVQSGATLGELYYGIAKESGVHAFPGGTCPSVCVGGLFLGGGYGPMMRKFGLSVDNIIDAQLVDSEGRILDRKSMGEDLFWAIRGGGASFGVVLAYKIKLVQVPELVTVFQLQRTLEENATNIVNQWQHVAHKLDDNLFIRLVLDVVKNESTGAKTIRATFVALFLGSSSQLVTIVNDKFNELGLRDTDCIEMKWIESVLFWLKYPSGTPLEILLNKQVQEKDLVFVKRKSDFVQEPIPKDCLEGIWKKMIELEVPSMFFNPYGGRMSEFHASETPFPHRDGNFWKIQYKINWREGGSEAEEKHLQLARQIYEFMTPFVSKNPRGAFLNYKDYDLGTINNHEDSSTKTKYKEGSEYGIKYFKDNFHRLVQIKTKYDPCNVFRHEQSIPLLPDQEHQ